MEMIAMLNGLPPQTMRDYLDRGLSRTISSNVYAGLGRVPMTPEQEMLAARSGTIASRQFSVNQLGALPMSAREYAISSGVNQVTSGAAYKNYGLAGLGAMGSTSPWLLAGGLLLGLAAVGYLFAGEKSFGK
jgi:hypothetical protein